MPPPLSVLENKQNRTLSVNSNRLEGAGGVEKLSSLFVSERDAWLYGILFRTELNRNCAMDRRTAVKTEIRL